MCSYFSGFVLIPKRWKSGILKTIVHSLNSLDSSFTIQVVTTHRITRVACPCSIGNMSCDSIRYFTKEKLFAVCDYTYKFACSSDSDILLLLPYKCHPVPILAELVCTLFGESLLRSDKRLLHSGYRNLSLLLLNTCVLAFRNETFVIAFLSVVVVCIHLPVSNQCLRIILLV